MIHFTINVVAFVILVWMLVVRYTLPYKPGHRIGWWALTTFILGLSAIDALISLPMVVARSDMTWGLTLAAWIALFVLHLRVLMEEARTFRKRELRSER